MGGGFDTHHDGRAGHVHEVPQTSYAKNGDVHIAFQTFGSGPVDLVVVPEWITHVEAAWEHPITARVLRRLASFARVITFDKRGIGLSDPVPLTEVPSLEVWRDDLRTVLDAAGSERPVLVGHGHGGQMALLFAATLPLRTKSLILMNSYARLCRAPDYEWGIPPDVQDKVAEVTARFWGRPDSPTLDLIAPTVAGVEGVRDWWARLERLACSPGTAVAMQRGILHFDVRHILPSITVPTLVVQTAGDRFVRAPHGRYLADHIPNAAYLEVQGSDHWAWVGEAEEEVSAAVEEFATGAPARPSARRVLATVMFTDVVSSTTRAASGGDRAWLDVLEDLDDVTGRQVSRFGGRVIKATGDGHLATFDGPGRALSCAGALRDAVRTLGIDLRTGLHCGEIELRGGDVSGIAVHIAARVMAMARPGEVLISGSIPPLVAGSGFSFADRGPHELRGIPGTWELYALSASG